MAIPPLGWAHHRIFFHDDSTSWGVGQDLYLTGTGSVADLDDTSADIVGGFVSNVLPMLYVGTVCTGGRIQYSDGSSVVEGSSTADEFGTVGGSGLPINVALVTSWKIPSFYRGGKPRSYWGRMPASAQLTSRLWDDAYLGDFETGIQAWADDVNTMTHGFSTITLGVWHKVRAGVPLDPWEFDPIVGSAMQRRVCSQRRRLGALLPD